MKSMIMVMTFALTLTAGTNLALAKGNDAVKTNGKAATTQETKLTGNENARANGGKANAYGKAIDKLTGIDNARAKGGKALAEKDDEEAVEEVVVTEAVETEEAAPAEKLTGIDNARAKGGKAHAYGKSEDKLTGIENARAHGGKAYAYAEDEDGLDEDDVIVEDPTAIVEEGTEETPLEVPALLLAAVEPVTDPVAPVLTGVENARSHGGKAYAYGHSKKLDVIDLAQ